MSQGTPAFKMHMWVQLGDLVPDPGARVLGASTRRQESRSRKQRGGCQGRRGGLGEPLLGGCRPSVLQEQERPGGGPW